MAAQTLTHKSVDVLPTWTVEFSRIIAARIREVHGRGVDVGRKTAGLRVGAEEGADDLAVFGIGDGDDAGFGDGGMGG
jgi:hypothetical protein